MYYLIYTSNALPTTGETEQYDILTKSVKNNTELDLTGLLIYHNGTFIQMLEGPRDNVHKIYETIKKDERHDQVQTLISGTVEKRQFPDWRMALEVTHKRTFAEVDAYQSFLDSSQFLEGIQHDHIGVRLLKYFYEIHQSKTK